MSSFITMNEKFELGGKERIIRALREYLEELTKHDHTEADWYYLMGHIYQIKEFLSATGNNLVLYNGEGVYQDCIYRAVINGTVIYYNIADDSLIHHYETEEEKENDSRTVQHQGHKSWLQNPLCTGEH